MKQKLLNSFTWRGTLLVALLSCAFSAWADWQDDSKLTTSSITSVDTSSSYSGGNGSTTFGGTTGQNGVTNVKFSTTDIKGTITQIEVTANATSEVTAVVKVGTTTFTSKNAVIGTSSTPRTFTPSSGVFYCDNNEISVEMSYSKFKKHAFITVSSIKVTYMPCAEIPINSACYDVDVENNKRYYGTYSNPEAFVIPEGLTVHTVSVNENGALTVPNITSGIVPAGAGVMVSSSSAGNKTIFLTPNAGTINTTGNMLRPQTQVMEQTGYNFYYLTMNDNQIGFYRQNADGSLTFPTNVTNKAYLAVPTSTYNPNSTGEEVKGFAFGDGTNGIKAVETTEAENNAIYNLAGQRVSKMQKGIYVVNGKKMLVK